MTASLKYAAALISTNLKATLSLRGSFLLQAALMFLNNIMFLIVWWVIFQSAESIGGWTIHDLLVLQGVVAIGFGLDQVLTGGSTELARHIVDGGLDGWLTQPKPVLLQACGSKTSASGLGDIASGILMIFLSGKVDLPGWGVVIVAAVASGTVLLSSKILIQSVAFWFGPMKTAARQATHFAIMFSLYPPTIFSGALRLVLFTVVPAGYIGYLPKGVITEGGWEAFGYLMLAVGVYAGLALWAFDLGLKRYASGNRFGVVGN